MVDKAIDRTLPHKDDIDAAIDQKYDEKFQTNEGAVADFFLSTSLVSNYCASLPHDIFTKPTIQWSVLPDTHFVVKIVLPIQSSLKDEIRVRHRESAILTYK